jgi:hypothetical protein
MKTKLIFTLLLTLVSLSAVYSQANANHPTIASVKVSYKSVPQSSASVQTLQNIEVIPMATVSLRPDSIGNVSKIWFKILNAADSVLYQSNYNITSNTITNSAGAKLFENNNGMIFLSPGSAFTLKPYQYKVYTEDANSNLTAIHLTQQ